MTTTSRCARKRGEEPERPFSGKLNLRLGSELHREAALAAAAHGESLNNWLVQVVESATQARGERARNKPPAKQKRASGTATPKRRASGK